jgi:hypothetical protein
MATKIGNNRAMTRLFWAVFIALYSAFMPKIGVAQEKEREITFAWEPIPGAVGYEIEFSIKVGENFKVLKPYQETEKAKWKGNLAPGMYQFRLRAKDTRGVPGVWSQPADLVIGQFPVEVISPARGAEILTKQEEVFKVKLVWKKMTGVKSYKVDIVDVAGKSIKSMESTTPFATVELPVAAAYNLTVQTVSTNGEAGDPMKEPVGFSLVGKRLGKPEAKIKPADIDDEVTWSQPNFTESFQLVVSYAKPQANSERKKRRKNIKSLNLSWQPQMQEPIYKESSFQLEGRPYGFYHLEITGQAHLRSSSKPLIIEFEYKEPNANVADLAPDDKYRGTIAYSYIPSLRTFRQDAGLVQTDLKILMLNSNRIAAGYWFFSHRLGLEAGVQRVYSELFGRNGKVTGPPGQEPVPLTYWHFDIGTKFHLDFGGFGFDLLGGIGRRSLHSLVSTPTATIERDSASIIESTYGGRIFVKFWETTLGVRGGLGAVLSADNFKISDDQRLEYGIDLTRNIVNDHLLISFGLGSDASTYTFTTDSQAEPRTLKVNLRTFEISLTWRY